MRGVVCLVVLALVSACAKTSVSGKDGAADRAGVGNADGAPGGQTPAAGSGGSLPDAGGSGGADGTAMMSPCEQAKANRSAQGCEFYSVAPSTLDSASGSCFAALLTNTWTSAVTIQVSYDGKPLNVSGMARTPKGSGPTLTYDPLIGDQLPPGQVAILFLSGRDNAGIPCPAGVVPGISTDPAISATGTGKAFQITASAPIVAYDIFPYGGARSLVSSATLLIPTSAWGSNYMAVDAYEADPGFAPRAPFVQIVAAEDATKVTLNPKVAIRGGGGIAASPAAQPQTFTLGKGEVLQLLQPAELAGSPITSDKPIGVWGGSSCMLIPVGVIACDSAHQQILPITWLGSEYVAVRYGDRSAHLNEDVPWTIVGTVDGTVLTYDPGPPPGAPTALGRGQMARFNASQPFIVRSNDDKHPFYVAGHMTSYDYKRTGGTDLQGDPEFVNTVPPQQWLGSYTFLTDVTYKTTHLVFVRQKAADMTFKDVTLDCVGTVAGWAPVGTTTQFEFARVDFNKQPGGCMDGAHTARSAAAFGLTVWGWDFAVSYAYPAGLSTKPINTVVVPVVE